MEIDAEYFLGPVRQFADNILRFRERQDRQEKIPLIGDAIDPKRDQWAMFDSAEVQSGAALSNPAHQQNLLRLLAGLTALTGDEKYRASARKIIRFVFDNLTDGQGLILWGGHIAYDLTKKRTVFAQSKGIVHELKFNYPFYEFMWDVDAVATRRYVEAFWNSHILNWSILDFNRHGMYGRPLGKLWRNGYDPGDVFFWGKGLTFVNTGSDLYYAAAVLAKMNGDQEPLTWAKRLASRYVETRQGNIGISGYQFSQSASSFCNGPLVRGDRAQYQYAPFIPDGHKVYEGTLFKPRPVVQRCQLYLGELLGQSGQEFTKWAIEEMSGWGRSAYREHDNAFLPMLTDGYSLEGFVIRKDGYFGPKGRVEGTMSADADFLWMYAYGYRVSGDSFLWEMARKIAGGNSLGDLGAPKGDGVDLNSETDSVDYRSIYAMLELYHSTLLPEYVNLAKRIGMNILKEYYREGWFMNGAGEVLVDNPVPLALLCLARTMGEKSNALPLSFL